jgi:hypothetical protein
LERNGIATSEEVAIDTFADRLREEATANECVTFFSQPSQRSGSAGERQWMILVDENKAAAWA